MTEESRMTRLPHCPRLLWLLGAILALTSCTYEAQIRRLAPAEQAEFRAYHKIMTASQACTYLTKATAAERTAYAHELGLAQRFQALAAQDRAAVLAGYPVQGMSTDAMRFLWGTPYAQKGRTNHYEHWYYVGASLSLAASGNQYHNFGNWVDAYFEDGRLVWWVDFIPTTNDASGDCNGC
jgi:hypothetical protein